MNAEAVCLMKCWHIMKGIKRNAERTLGRQLNLLLDKSDEEKSGQEEGIYNPRGPETPLHSYTVVS